jgi:hypothetical protein
MIASKKHFILALVVLMLVGGLAVTPRPALAADGSCAFYHWVRYGETLYSIGVAYGVHYTEIARVNNIANPRYIYAGQRLCIPSGGGAYYGTGGAYYYGTGGAYQNQYYYPYNYNYYNYNYNKNYYPYNYYYPYQYNQNGYWYNGRWYNGNPNDGTWNNVPNNNQYWYDGAWHSAPKGYPQSSYYK